MILNYFEHPVSSLLYLTDIVYGRKIKDDTGCFNLYFQISVYILVNYILKYRTGYSCDDCIAKELCLRTSLADNDFI